MNENKRSGSGLKIILLAGGLLVLGLAVTGLMRWQEAWHEEQVQREEAKQEAQEEANREAADLAQRMAAEAEAPRLEAAKSESARREIQQKRDVVVTAAALGHFSATDFGHGITREHYVAMMGDPEATELARQTFIKAATGQVVRWLLQLSNVKESNPSGALVADFLITYSIQVQNGTDTSLLHVQAEFPATERERLLPLRRSDWVTIEGRLQPGDVLTLLDAKIALPTDAEAPER